MSRVPEITFMLSAARAEQYPAPDRPEIALVGRSNVGKSSFTNALFQRKNIARTSSKPGKTQQLNYFDINSEWYLVDMPGYGYAKISKRERERWGRQLRQYLQQRENLMLTLVLVDFRHAPSAQDIEMIDQLNANEVPYFVIATKADKVKSNQWAAHTEQIKRDLNLISADQILPVSAVTKEGLDEAWEIINAVLAEEFME